MKVIKAEDQIMCIIHWDVLCVSVDALVCSALDSNSQRVPWRKRNQGNKMEKWREIERWKRYVLFGAVMIILGTSYLEMGR